MKHILKKSVQRTAFLKSIFISLYNARGKKPWSFGYSVYKFEFIKKILNQDLGNFRSGPLPDGYGEGLDERCVEYPWLFSRLKSSDQVLLDAGSTLNHLEILENKHLSGKKLFITTLAFEDVYRLANQPSYTYEDLRGLHFKDAAFDAVICLSTLEHIGLDNTYLYSKDVSKKESSKFAFLDAIKEFKRVLKPGGTLYLSVPFGQYKNHEWFQIFDSAMTDRLIKEFAPDSVQKTFFKYEKEQWNFSNEKACENGYYFDVHKDPSARKDKPAASECVLCFRIGSKGEVGQRND